MRLLRLAIEEQRWDLAAHTIILATARLLKDKPPKSNKRGGGRPYVSTKSKEQTRRPKGQSER